MGLAVYIGGGQGRTPMVAKKIRDFLPIEDMLTYVTAIVRVYNLYGRRDNKYKSAHQNFSTRNGIESLVQEIDAEWEQIRFGDLKLPQSDIDAIENYFRCLICRPDRKAGGFSLQTRKQIQLLQRGRSAILAPINTLIMRS
ncbi:hypothetical protein ACFOLL_14680 [Falsochrobactrum ovis]|uniref:hypothetical protein n=1 Tax=Falsochrobactrum ovis TaxID=1293442 RepID=UPI0036153665